MAWRARDSDEHTPIIRRAPLHCQRPNPSADASYSLLPRHAPQTLCPLPVLCYISTCPPHCGRPPCCHSGWLRWRRFRDQPHSRHPGPCPPCNALWRRPSWSGDDSTGPARQLCGGGRAVHQRNRGSAGAAGHRTKRTSAGAGAHSSKRGQRRSRNTHAAGGLPRERDRAHQHCSR